MKPLLVTLAIPGAFLVSGCLGTDAPTFETEIGQETLSNFTDGSAVVRVIAAEASVVAPAAIGTSYTVSTARVPSAIIPSSSPFDIETTDLSPLVSTAHGEVHSGSVVINGNSYDVRMFTDSTSSVELISAYDATLDDKYTIVTGSKVSDIPTGDLDYNYTGQNLVAATNNTDFIAGGGSFSMTVNFEDKTGTIDATSSTANTSLAGGFEVDTDTGFFSGDNLILNAPNLPSDTTAVILGSFHDEAALGVSGLYYDAGDSPLVNGAIIGSR
jgi:hypothetical protein